MKKDRNCNMNMPVYPFPSMMPGVTPVNPMDNGMNFYNNSYPVQSNSFDQQISNLNTKISSLERRISNLESLVGNNTTYNTTNYQML